MSALARAKMIIDAESPYNIAVGKNGGSAKKPFQVRASSKALSNQTK